MCTDFKSPFEDQIRIIQLVEKDLKDVVYRIQKGTTLQFRLSPSLYGCVTSLYTNHPNSSVDTFCRGKYHKVQWTVDRQNEETFSNVRVLLAGNFQYYFTKDGSKSGSGYFIVDPVLTYGLNNKVLQLNSISCQTVMAKSLGAFDNWENRLQVSYRSGYNVIHFTPIQELGVSNSSYSISNQLKLNPLFGKISFEDVKRLIDKIRTNWGVLSICDLVLNHTANETPWLETHPECGYNLFNSPHLRTAYLLDCILWEFSWDISQEKYESRGLPAKVCNEDHLDIIRVILRDDLIPKLKLEEMYTIDVNATVAEFVKRSEACKFTSGPLADEHELTVVQNKDFCRLKSTVDLDLALSIYYYKWQNEDDTSAAARAVESFKNKLFQLNERIRKVLQSHLNAAVENVISGIRYERLQADGPRYEIVSDKYPLVHRYFEKIGLPKRQELSEEENLSYSVEKSQFIMAHNGWVMNDDPLRNFAESDSNVYLRRELIAWGDSIKLRYGMDPSSCPFLWDTMKSYVETTARIFAGIRLDNCHSTPIKVAEYLLDAARNIKPDLYVVAELFTNSEKMDNIFVNRLGIGSLIREALSAWNAHEEGRLVFLYGGQPVGAFRQEQVRPLMPCIAHALLMDMTHDNPSPIEKRSVYDVLPTAALVSMASCASGSSRGLDELVPHHIHVVDEVRFYQSWSEQLELKPGFVNDSIGILEAKRVINNLHFQLGEAGFIEVYVDQMEPDIVAVTRHNPGTHEKVVLVTYTAFHNPDANYQRCGGINDINIEGVLEEIIFEARLQPIDKSTGNFPRPTNFTKNTVFVNGLLGFQTEIRENLPVESSKFVKFEGTAIKFVDFQPGSVIVFRINPPDSTKLALTNLKTLLNRESLTAITESLSLRDLNKVLYKCEEEERDEYGGGAYIVPNFGSLVYCGLQGINSILADIRLKNDMGHALCDHLRAGNWLMDYTAGRLLKDERTRNLAIFLQKCFQNVAELPRFLVPGYFDLILRGVYMACLDSTWGKMSNFVQVSSPFTRSLAVGSLQCCGLSKSGPLPFLCPNLANPRPKIRLIEGEEVQDCVTLSAGLPHFSTGYMRNWGRDTFISLPGLLLVTGRYQEARYHILAYASVLRHGLIPNLLDRGTNARYNCRDATWFWLESIKKYVEFVPQGEAIFKDRVSRMWPNDFGDAVLDHSVEQSLEDVMQESIQKHFQGINFRERNAGQKIDAHMKDEGFSVQAGIHEDTGFVYGGNAFNCGTWMDKMGSSEKAGNKGVPATPRDGSAVELVGLSASVLHFLSEMYQAGKYRYNFVERADSNGIITQWTFSDWYTKIKHNFEKYFWIPENPQEKSDPNGSLINRRGIYKDTIEASAKYCDFQLRPNFLIAMTIAPELFDLKNAMVSLANVKQILLSSLGLKTLDPSDWNYNGNYDNSNDSADMKIAHGFNYHNGPEWLWPVGFYLRAYLKISSKLGDKEFEDVSKHVKVVMSNHWSYLQSSPWKSLPELTNKNGAVCHGSCTVQAWSVGLKRVGRVRFEELTIIGPFRQHKSVPVALLHVHLDFFSEGWPI